MQRLTGIILLLVVVLLASSCGNVKNLQYVQGAFDTARLSKVQFTDPVIQTGDLLGISVLSDDAKATAIALGQLVDMDIDPTNMKASPVTDGDKFSKGYIVSQDGKIRLYRIGTVHVAGLSRKALADTLANRYVALDLLKNPFVDVRFLNYKITLVGEVSRPGVYSFPTDKVSIFDAIGLAGDITVYGKRNNVLLVREINGVREVAHLDLSKSEIFASPYYYLQQNDMVIVDVAKNKSVISDQTTVRNITVAASILATVAIFVNIFR